MQSCVRFLVSGFLALGGVVLIPEPACAATIYNNLTVTNQMASASRPSSANAMESETADDFVIASQTSVTSASFIGLIVPGASGTPSVTDVAAEIYRVFPLDSNTARTPTVPTRVNSPADVALASQDSAAGGLTFTTTVLSSSFTAANSIQAGQIHAAPNQTTGGGGPLTGEEVEFTVTFSSPLDLAADHYFFVPQVLLSNGAHFYWLSASRPISGPGTTPFPAGSTDLQAWTRDQSLDPDWLRIGGDIVGGGASFNMAFSLDGTTDTTATPEPATLLGTGLALSVLALARRVIR